MNTLWLQKCLVICWILCSMCPKRSIQSEIKEAHKNAVYISKTLSSVSEPGFNYTEEEMEKFKIWPKGIIPYFIDEYSFDANLREKLRSLLESFNDVTGLGFMELVRPPNDENQRWVFIVNRRGQLACEDYTTLSFTNTGVQRVVLGYDCLNGGSGGSLAAIVLALAGVPPQHNAPDRNLYISVKTENIKPDKKKWFEALKNDEWLFHDITYDYLSAGHYDFHKYSVNGQATIKPRRSFLNLQDLKYTVGEGDGLSSWDILKIKMLYNFISLDRKNAKASDCSLLFKPVNGMKILGQYSSKTTYRINPRDKPQKYLGMKDSNNSYRDDDGDEGGSGSDNVNKKQHKVLKFRGSKKTNSKDILAILSDFDTDEDRDRMRKRKTKGRQMLNSKIFDRGEYKNQISLLSDYDTDKDKNDG